MPAAGLLRVGSRAGMADPRGLLKPTTVSGPPPLPSITTTNGVPDPNAVTAAQIAANNQTAAYNNAMTHGSTSTPLGTQTSTSHIDPATGATVYDTNVSLPPDVQAALNQQNKNTLALTGTAGKVARQVDSAYGSPMPTSSYSWSDLTTARQNAQDALYGKQSAYLDPQYQQLSDALANRLSQQGVNLATNPDAYKLAMDTFNRSRSFDYGQARDSAIAGAGTEMQRLTDAAGAQQNQQLQLRNEPMAEYKALQGSTDINIPQFNQPQTALSAGVNPGQNAYTSAEQQIQQQAIQAGNRNAVTSGLFGLGADILGAAPGSLAGSIGSKISGLFGLGSGTPATAEITGSLPAGAFGADVAGAAGAGAAGAGAAGAGATGTYGSLGALGGTSSGIGAGGSLIGAGGAADAAGAAGAGAAGAGSSAGAGAVGAAGAGSVLGGLLAGGGTLAAAYGVSRILANQGKMQPADFAKHYAGVTATARDNYNRITAGMASGKYSMADRVQAWQQLQQASQNYATYLQMLGPKEKAKSKEIFKEFGQALPDWVTNYMRYSGGSMGGK